AAHAFDHFARNHPVSEIAVLGDLHCAEDREIDVPAADHGEAVGGREITAGRDLRYRLLAGIDEVRILLAFVRERAESEHAVLALQLHAHAPRYVVGNQCRNADTEIDVKAVAQLLGGAFGHLLACPGHQPSSPVPAGAAFRLRTVRCSMCLTAFGTCTKRFT